MKSIDYVVMECGVLGWTDGGRWSSVWDVLDHDAAGNATEGPVVVMDSINSLLRSEASLLTAVPGFGRTAQGAQSPRRDRAPPCLSTLGLLPGRGRTRPPPSEAHRREAGQHALPAKALVRLYGGCTKMSRSISRLVAFTGSPTLARSRSNWSRCRSAVISVRTTSCGWRTFTAADSGAPAPGG
jgi:hypothetical protein